MPWGGFLIGGTVGQGAPRPLYPHGTRGIAPGPNLRRRRLLLQSFFRMLHEEQRSRGLRAPCTPTAGGFPLHPFCDTEDFSSRLLSACCMRNNEAGGFSPPVPPAAGLLALHPFCD